MNEGILGAVDREFQPVGLERTTRHIAEIERTFCYSRFAESARYCCEQMEAAGLADVQLFTLPADGQTTYLDFTMPQAWDAEDAALEIVTPGHLPIPLIDYHANPLCVANRCAPTPLEGLVAEVISAQQLHARSSAAGQFVYSEGQAPSTLRAEAAAKGAAGLISDFSPAREVAPDETYWVNGWGYPGWYATREHTPLVCFSIAPSKGKLLRDLLSAGAVQVRARARTRLYDGSIYTAAGLVPGKQAREIVLLAHIYEPFICDDAIGAAAAIEIGRMLAALTSRGALPPLDLGVRVLIAMERYGFAHYFQQRDARERALLGISLDCLCLSPTKTGEAIEVRYSPASMPFWGDALLWHMAQRRLAGRPLAVARGNLSDDTWISDVTVGIPAQWVWTRVGATHHSSLWFQEEMNDWALGGEIAKLIAGYVGTLATASGAELERFRAIALQGLAEEAERQRRAWTDALGQGRLSAAEVRREIAFWVEWQEGRVQSLARMYPACDVAPLRSQLAALGEALSDEFAAEAAAPQPAGSGVTAQARNMILSRKTIGMPFSQARIPLPERMAGDYEQALSWADGKRDLWEIAERVRWDGGGSTDDAWLERFICYCQLLAQYGYIDIAYRTALTKYC